MNLLNCTIMFSSLSINIMSYFVVACIDYLVIIHDDYKFKKIYINVCAPKVELDAIQWSDILVLQLPPANEFVFIYCTRSSLSSLKIWKSRPPLNWRTIWPISGFLTFMQSTLLSTFTVIADAQILKHKVQCVLISLVPAFCVC